MVSLGRRHCPQCLSIPAWFDWREVEPGDWLMGVILSIPAWFDWRIQAQDGHEPPKFLSIPAWFDWRPT